MYRLSVVISILGLAVVTLSKPALSQPTNSLVRRNAPTTPLTTSAARSDTLSRRTSPLVEAHPATKSPGALSLELLSKEFIQSQSSLNRRKLRLFFEKIDFKLSDVPTPLPEYNPDASSGGVGSQRGSQSRPARLIPAIRTPLVSTTTDPAKLKSKGGELHFAPRYRYEAFRFTRDLAKLLDDAVHAHNRGQAPSGDRIGAARVGLKAYQGMKPEEVTAMSPDLPVIDDIRDKAKALKQLHGRGHISNTDAEHLAQLKDVFLKNLKTQ
ncbi:hypothetical protein IWQ60_000506 [Tieghemiomyces parasiticus]|uniref:Uncharacterized protein n=1 Tax=Tieghemiomyces parasiticus TaxID=78921 RepID=A0A9W8E2R5_9FUNG|nr:hypothetical protein IWQ60_000506 [Tieghemiomyces parasiticus]